MEVLWLLVLVVVCQALPQHNDWMQFKIRHRKKYGSLDEEQKRLKIFLRNKRYIDEHNRKYDQGLVSFSLRLNHLSDLTIDEYTSLLKPKVSTRRNLKSEYFQKSSKKIPEEVDWRERGAVTPVKNQGTCDACWAFSVTGAIEGHLFLKTKKLVSLSEQQLVDCSKNNGGCNGGDAFEAYEYLQHVDGIESEDGYPYRDLAGNCSSSRGSEIIGISGYQTIPPGDERALQEAVAEGPVSVSVDARSVDFMFYYKGVFYSQDCSSTAHNMAALVVGYGEERGKEFWLVKNSLGVDWGDFGYIKMARNRGNNCAIASHASFPNLQ